MNNNKLILFLNLSNQQEDCFTLTPFLLFYLNKELKDTNIIRPAAQEPRNMLRSQI